MGHAGARAAKQIDLARAHVNAVGVPHVIAGPAQRFDIRHGAQAKRLQTECFFLNGLGQMCVQPHTIGAGQGRRFAHQVGRDGERRTRGQHHPRHGMARGVVIGLDEPAAVAQDKRFVFGHTVGRQAALAFAQGHRAARGVEAHPDISRGAYLAVQRAIVREDIEVIAAGRATRQG